MSELATAPRHGEVHASFDVEHGAAPSSSSSSASAAPPPARSTAWSLPPASFSDACRTSLLSAEQRESPRFRPLPASSDEETPSLASPVGASPRCSAALQGSFLVSASGLGASLEMKRIIWMLLWALSMLLTLSAPGPPFGKYNIAWADVVEVLYKWPACAFGAGYLLLFAVFAGFGCIVTPRSWLAIGPALFCFHLFEENGLNGLDARRSPFKAHANLVLKTLCGKTSWEPDFLSDASVMVFSFLHVGGTHGCSQKTPQSATRRETAKTGKKECNTSNRNLAKIKNEQASEREGERERDGDRESARKRANEKERDRGRQRETEAKVMMQGKAATAEAYTRSRME
ncbi:putative transmembrane protein, partial [Toxoplasma gondii FOU]